MSDTSPSSSKRRPPPSALKLPLGKTDSQATIRPSSPPEYVESADGGLPQLDEDSVPAIAGSLAGTSLGDAAPGSSPSSAEPEPGTATVPEPVTTPRESTTSGGHRTHKNPEYTEKIDREMEAKWDTMSVEKFLSTFLRPADNRNFDLPPERLQAIGHDLKGAMKFSKITAETQMYPPLVRCLLSKLA